LKGGYSQIPGHIGRITKIEIHKEAHPTCSKGSGYTGRDRLEDISPQLRAAGFTSCIFMPLTCPYRSWLDDAGVPVGVQRELMRHASIQTTMNVYGRAMSEGKRQANTNVVDLVLNSENVLGKAARPLYWASLAVRGNSQISRPKHVTSEMF
jgi:hypothetical protein